MPPAIEQLEKITVPTLVIVALLPKNPRVLDLGCGGGYESMCLMQAEAQEVVGIDFSEESIRITQERCPQARFESMDFRQLDSQKLGKFDGIFACASLIHIKQEELPSLFQQFAWHTQGKWIRNYHYP